jgi:hypothetical protein
MVEHLKKRFPEMEYVGYNTTTIYFYGVHYMMNGRTQERANAFLKQYFNTKMFVYIYD